MLEEYAAIVLLGFVNTPELALVTTELTVGFEINLLLVTKDRNSTSLMVTTGPNVAVNIVLGLSFIKATGMVSNFVDNICDAMNLLREPFPIDIKRATKSIPVFQSSPDHAACIGSETASILHVLGLLRSYYDQSLGGKLPHVITQSPEGEMRMVANV
jgi:hypothetical protein